jgi:hypothetical protein
MLAEGAPGFRMLQRPRRVTSRVEFSGGSSRFLFVDSATSQLVHR